MHPMPSIPPRLRHGLMPLLAALTLLYLGAELALAGEGRPGRFYGAFLAAVVLLLVIIEHRHPAREDWRMTRARFLRRDLPFLLLGAATIGSAQVAAAHALAALDLPRPAALAGVPLLPGVALSLLLTDGLWYAVHRACHEAQGRAGALLWRLHVAHHRPAQVYVLMHAVAHPLNTLLVRALLTVPPWLLGLPADVVFCAGVVTAVQGLVSHFNADVRAGVLDRVFMGTELHRWHHAVGVRGNYGGVLSVWDRLCGTLVERPGELPAALGTDGPARAPARLSRAASRRTAPGSCATPPTRRRHRSAASCRCGSRAACRGSAPSRGPRRPP